MKAASKQSSAYNARESWLVAVAACLFMFAGCSSLNMLTPILPMMLEDLDATTNFASAMYFVDTATSAVLTIPAAAAINRWGFKRVGYAGYAALLVSFLWGAMPFARETTQLLLIRMLQGVGYAIPPILCIAIIPQWFPEDKQGIPLAIISCMANVAKVAMLQISKITIPLGGWQGQFAGTFVLCLISFVFYVLFLKEKPVADGGDAVKTHPIDRESLLGALGNRGVWLLTLIMCAFTLGRRSFDPFSNMIWMDNCGISGDHASDIDSVFFFMNIPSGLLFGLILSKVPRRGTLCAAMLSLYFCGMSSAFLLHQSWEALAFALVVGLLGSVPAFCQTAMPLVVKDPGQLTMALSVTNLIGKYIVGSIAPFAVSTIQASTGSWMYCSVPIVITGALALIACWRIAPILDRNR